MVVGAVEVGAADDEDVDVASDPGTVKPVGSSDSDGHGSPGCSMNDEFAASAFCVPSGVVALGLMTPTIWCPMHEFGAVQ